MSQFQDFLGDSNYLDSFQSCLDLAIIVLITLIDELYLENDGECISVDSLESQQLLIPLPTINGSYLFSVLVIVLEVPVRFACSYLI